MKKELEMVKEFQRVFSQPIAELPTLIDVKAAHRRFHLMKEELDEYQDTTTLDAISVNGKYELLAEIADALGDLLYTVYGTIIEHGLTDIMPEIFEIIHKSNMSKLDDDGNPVYTMTANGVKKVGKSDNFYRPEPNIIKVIQTAEELTTTNKGN